MTLSQTGAQYTSLLICGRSNHLAPIWKNLSDKCPECTAASLTSLEARCAMVLLSAPQRSTFTTVLGLQRRLRALLLLCLALDTCLERILELE